jgi:hypothetical protein
MAEDCILTKEIEWNGRGEALLHFILVQPCGGSALKPAQLPFVNNRTALSNLSIKLHSTVPQELWKWADAELRPPL